MRRAIAFCTLLPLLTIAQSEMLAQDIADKPLQLKAVFSDDFSNDSSEDYEIDGNAVWANGQLTLSEGAWLSREIGAGSWVVFALELPFPKLEEGQDSAELRLWLHLNGATDCCVCWETRRENGAIQHLVQVVDTERDDNGKLRLYVKREWTLQVGDGPNPWRVSYRNGLFSLSSPAIQQAKLDDVVTSANGERKQAKLLAFIDNGEAETSEFSLHAVSGEFQLNRIQSVGSKRQPELSKSQLASVSRANALNSKLVKQYKNGEYSSAVKLGEEVLEIRRTVLGEQHPDFATSLNNLASLYESMGDYARAEPLHRKALGIRKNVLGEWHPDFASSLNNLASLYESMGDYARAEPFYKQARDIREAVLGKRHPDFATSLNNLASLYESMGDYARAEPLYKQAGDIREAALGKQHPKYAASLNNLAGLFSSMGEYERAEPLYKQARDIRKTTLGGNHPSYAASLNNLGVLYKNMADYERAEPLLEQSTKIHKRIYGEQSPVYATSLNNLASLYNGMGDFKRALPLYRQALAIRKEVLGDKHPDYATSLNNLAGLYESSGDYKRAELLYRQGLAIRKVALGERHPDYATSLNDLAFLYAGRSDYARAEPLYVEARDIRKKTLGELHPAYATSLNNLASLYFRMADYARAEPLFKKAKDLRKTALGEHHPDYATSLNNLATLYDHLGDYERAEPLHKRATDLRKSALGEQHPDYAASLNNLASLYGDTGRFDQAELLHRQALAIRQAVLGEQHPDYAASLNNLAFLYRRTGDDARAQPLFEQARKTLKAAFGEHHHQYAASLQNLATACARLGDFAAAERHFVESETIARSYLDANSPVQSERQQKRNQAEKRHYINWRIANFLQGNGRPTACLEAVWRWKGAVSRRQQAYRSVSASRELRPLFIELQSISQQLSVVSSQPPTPPVSATDLQQRNYKRRRTLWKQRFVELTERREELEQEIATRSELFRETLKPLTVAKVQSLLPAGAALVDFLDYDHPQFAVNASGKTNWERRYLAFVVTRDKEAQVIALGSHASMTTLVDAFRRPYVATQNTADNRKAAAQAGRRLRKQLWEPIASRLAGIETIIISPDTELGALPFAALPGRQSSSFLIEDYRLATIPYANSISHLLSRPKHRRTQAGLLLLGDIDFDAVAASQELSNDVEQLTAAAKQGRSFRRRDGTTAKWSSLPGFLDEMRVVDSLYRKTVGEEASINSLTGAAATEGAFLQAAEHHNVLHVITHGYFANPSIKSIDQAEWDPGQLSGDEQGPDAFVNTWLPGLLSGLVMAGANHPPSDEDAFEDGILRAAEIETASLDKVDLVVLSACETGLGAVAGGEGLTGLQRAFQMAGAKSVIASLWKVEDTATTELIRQFYTNLWLKEMSKLDALREAQLSMIRGYDPQNGVVRGLGAKPIKINRKLTNSGKLDPYYWAAFQLSGDWR